MDPMLELRYPRFWLGTSLVILISILVMAVLPSTALPMVGGSDKLTHLVSFVLLMTWFSGMFRFRLSPLVATGLVAYGILIELLQIPVDYRYAELADVWFDVGGIAIGWLVAAVGFRGWCRKVESWMPDRG